MGKPMYSGYARMNQYICRQFIIVEMTIKMVG